MKFHSCKWAICKKGDGKWGMGTESGNKNVIENGYKRLSTLSK